LNTRREPGDDKGANAAAPASVTSTTHTTRRCATHRLVVLVLVVVVAASIAAPAAWRRDAPAPSCRTAAVCVVCSLLRAPCSRAAAQLLQPVARGARERATRPSAAHRGELIVVVAHGGVQRW
jgi:hypothetical protein